jgi:putative ABC transport system permease protein
MNVRESFLTAIGALLANKLRAILTMLGIIIGVAAVITMIAIGEGSQQAVMQRIQSMGSDLIFVQSGAQRGGGSTVVQSGTSVRLRLSDADAISRQASTIEAVVPELNRNAQVKYENRNWNTHIIGTTPEYETVRNFPIVAGRYFSNSEAHASSKVAVIGATIVENLFSDVDPIGRTIRIAGQSFQVIGILQAKGASGFQNPDDQIIVPVSTAQRRIFGLDYLSQITVKVPNQQASDEAFLDIERILRKEHKLRDDQDNDFSIRNQADLITTFQETQQTFTFLLAGIAAVSLVVGGIGIMNIMIVSVTERTREIGIRKAIGGCFGIFVGIFASYLISLYGNLSPVISVNSIAVSFLFSSFVGIFFGMYPAWKAATSDIIDALRYE